MKKICCFAGHNSNYNEDILTKLEETVINLITKNGVNEFWVGNYGEFDRVCAHTVKKAKKEYPCVTLHLVIPYLTKEITLHKDYYSQQYDSVISPKIDSPEKYKIIKANQYMVDNSTHLICYIDHSWGGAYKTYAYAQQKEINIINLYK